MAVNVAVGVANVALVEAGLPRVDMLVAALNSTLWVLDHPDVNALNFAGNPRGLASRLRALIAPFGTGSDMTADPRAEEAFGALRLPQGLPDDIAAMSEQEIDDELRALGIDPEIAAKRVGDAIAKATAPDSNP
jgi:hypothetical protein